METITTTDTSKPNFKIAVAVDMQTIFILGACVFVAIVGALLIYKYSPGK